MKNIRQKLQKTNVQCAICSVNEPRCKQKMHTRTRTRTLDTASPCFPTVQSQKRVFILPRLGVGGGGGEGGGAVDRIWSKRLSIITSFSSPATRPPAAGSRPPALATLHTILTWSTFINLMPGASSRLNILCKFHSAPSSKLQAHF